MSEKKKKPSRMKVKSKISKTNTSLKIGLTVVLIYWSIIKWVILIVIKGGSKVWHYIKRYFFSIKRRLISIGYRSIIKRSFKLIGKFFYNILKIPVIILLSPFLLLRKIYRSFNKLEVKFRLLSCQFVILVLLFGAGYAGSILYLAVLKDLPSSTNLYNYDPNLTTRIYDRKGNLLYRLYFNEDRIPVALNDIPGDFINATIAVEDEEFYMHQGLSWRGILRAAKINFSGEDFQGGSTITQQLVKNLLLTPDRTWERKAKEAVLALEVERRFTKDQILEMYLNNISFGGTSYGVKSAAKRYFGKELKDLTLAESAYLAGLPAAPTLYSPFGATPEKGKIRQEEVLYRMVAAKFISKEEANNAMLEELIFADKTDYLKYPHFVNYVIDVLNKKYGQMYIAKGGLEVYTSIDPELQEAVEEINARQVSALRRYKVSNGAALVTNPSTGEILAMVGSVNYWDEANDGNVNVTTSSRQPGSSIKPLTYALYIDGGATPYKMIEDSPVQYKLPNGDVYKPTNYDGRFHGVMPLKSALANSYNIPAVKIADELTVEEILRRAPDFGITTWTQPERYGLSITLGAAEVKMTELAEVYGTFANGGQHKDLDPILKIYDAYGNTIAENGCVEFSGSEEESILTRRALSTFENNHLGEYEGIKSECKKERVISERTAYYITDMLSDNRARTPAFGANSNLNIRSKQVAVKTGTTTSVRDNWAVGYTNNYTVLTWIGNNDNSKMGNIASGATNSASSLWREIFNYIINNKSVPDKITINPELVEVSICPLTNTLSCNACRGVSQKFVKGDEPTKRCNDDEVKRLLGDEDEDDEDKDKRERNYDYWLD
jgi:1A family penicillin-binding protein